MPEYYVIANDPTTHPDYAYNERVVNTETFLIYDNRVHTPEMSSALEYTRFRITTEYYDIYGMGDRGPASRYHGSLRPPGYEPSRMTNYVPAGIAAVLSSTESRVGGSLPSKPKTRGTLKPSSKKFLSGTTPYAYKPKSDERCRRGYKSVIKSGRRMCVKIDG